MIPLKDLLVARDMPKLESPFVREGEKYQVIDKVNEGYEWVFESDKVLATEKLDGTDVSIIVQGGKILRIFNRENLVDFWDSDYAHIIEALRNSKNKINRLADGQWFGEVIGPKLAGNPYKLKDHRWYIFELEVREQLAYNSWGKYPKTYEAISNWFEQDIFSIFNKTVNHGETIFPEGVVFHNLETGAMSKLRRDMFPWFRGQKHNWWKQQHPAIQIQA